MVADFSYMFANSLSLEYFQLPDGCGGLDLSGNIPGTQNVAPDGNATLEVIYL